MNEERAKKVNFVRKIWNAIAKGWVTEVPENIAFCEFDCRKSECLFGEWKTCGRRHRYKAGIRDDDEPPEDPEPPK